MVRIQKLPTKTISRELGSRQGSLDLHIDKETEIQGIGMGVLSDGTAFLNQRGLARVCGVENAHIGTISSGWNEDPEKPRITKIKDLLANLGRSVKSPHIEFPDTTTFAYPDFVCLAILEYYTFEAGPHNKEIARKNFRILAGTALRNFIYEEVGYDPNGLNSNKFDKWHERISLNYQSAPNGFFHVFNEANTIIYELINAGAPIDDNFVVDISIGLCWSKFWQDNQLDKQYGERTRYPHRYPSSHPQSKSNPQESWCYPFSALGHYRGWLKNHYLEGGKFTAYLERRVCDGKLSQSIARLAIESLVPKQIETH